jgi:hypothetical protein
MGSNTRYRYSKSNDTKHCSCGETKKVPTEENGGEAKLSDITQITNIAGKY